MTIIRLKRSSVPNKEPDVSNLQLGEIAINTNDGKAWFKQVTGTVSTIIGFITQNGGTLLNFLTLHADPVNLMHAANKRYVDNHTTYVYNSSDLISTKPKIWVGRVKSNSSGLWTVNYTSAGFSQILSVQATANSTSTSRDDWNFASVRQSTITNTSVSGTASRSTSSSLLGIATTLQAAAVDIDVLVIGI